jgi:hypothetical protein
MAILIGATNDSNAGADYLTQLSRKILEGNQRYAWLLDNGSTLVEQVDPDKTSALVYARDGNLLWRQEFGAKQRIMRTVEFDGVLYLLMFEHWMQKGGGERKVGFGCSLMSLLGLCDVRNDQFKDAYEVGEYRLYQCKPLANCENAITFEQGVSDLAVNSSGLWVVEFNFDDVHHPVEAPPVLPKRAYLKQYSFDSLQVSQKVLFEGLRAIDLGSSQETFLALMHNSEGDVNRHGIYESKGGQTKRVGGYQPGKVFSGYTHPYCSWFLFDVPSEETLCVEYAPTIFRVWLIKKDGSISRPLDSRIFPKRLLDGRVLVATSEGQLLEIHLALGE